MDHIWNLFGQHAVLLLMLCHINGVIDCEEALPWDHTNVSTGGLWSKLVYIQGVHWIEGTWMGLQLFNFRVL